MAKRLASKRQTWWQLAPRVVGDAGHHWLFNKHGQGMASRVTPASHLSAVVMCKEHEKDQPAPGPWKSGDQ